MIDNPKRSVSGKARRLVLSVLCALLPACGGGGGSSPPPAPTGLSYSSPQVYVVSHSIAALTPSVTGTVTSFAVSPALPPGLSLNPATGTISGTPTAPSALSSYSVVASNAGGSASATISITVDDVPPVISYGATNPVLTTGVPITPIAPVSSGGAVVTWSISPPLPAGLMLDPTNGSLVGTPVAVTPAATYVVRAENSGGFATAALSFAIESGVLLDLGHADGIGELYQSSSRLLSIDDYDHWVLWDKQTAKSVAAGEGSAGLCFAPCGIRMADLAGPTFAIRMRDSVEVRSSADGHVLGTIPVTTQWWRLAPDGSYLVALTAYTSDLTVWSASGVQLVSRVGTFSRTSVFAADGEVRVGGGPAGANVVEVISIPSGATTITSPYTGTFAGWFLDGERFLTTAGNTVSVYSKAVVREDIRVLPTVTELAGQGPWFWTHAARTLTIYAVGASATPAASYSAPASVMPSGQTIGLLGYSEPGVSVVDLTGAAPVKTDYANPVPHLHAYTSLAPNQWIVGSAFGVIVDAVTSPTPRYFGYGMAHRIAGSAHRVAVAVASGKILYFDADTGTEEGRIEFPSSQIELSADGTVLFAAVDDDHWPDRTLKLFSLPLGVETRSWPYLGTDQPWPDRIFMSGSGNRLGKVLDNFPTGIKTGREVTTATGAPIWSDRVPPLPVQQFPRDNNPIPIRLSPDGTLIAVPDRAQDPDTGTSIFKNGNLVAAVSGWPVVWLDDNRLLINTYQVSAFTHFYRGCAIVSPAGQALGPCPLKEDVYDGLPVSPDTVYSPYLNSIYSLSTGDATWTSASASPGASYPRRVGAVASSRVVFASGAVVRTEPYR